MIKDWIVSSSEELDPASSQSSAKESHKASSQELANPQVSILGLDVSLSLGFPEREAYKVTSRAQRLLSPFWTPFPPLTHLLSKICPYPSYLSFHLTPLHPSHSPNSMQRSALPPARMPSSFLRFHRALCLKRPRLPSLSLRLHRVLCLKRLQLPSLSLRFHRALCLKRLQLPHPTRCKRTSLPDVPMCSARS